MNEINIGLSERKVKLFAEDNDGQYWGYTEGYNPNSPDPVRPNLMRILIKFPRSIMEEKNFKLGDEFFYYPPTRGWIEPEDCLKEPKKIEPLDWELIAKEELKKVRPYL